MHDRSNLEEKARIYLKPGELSITSTPATVTTVLGSCVTVTMFHYHSKLAAISHTLQPKCPRPDECVIQCQSRYRYTVCTIEEMSRYMLTYGLLPREIEVKLFGGAALIGTSRYREMSNSIGQQNVKAAIDTINSCGLLLKIMDVGGAFGRKIIFNTWTGEVLLKRLNKLI